MIVCQIIALLATTLLLGAFAHEFITTGEIRTTSGARWSMSEIMMAFVIFGACWIAALAPFLP